VERGEQVVLACRRATRATLPASPMSCTVAPSGGAPNHASVGASAATSPSISSAGEQIAWAAARSASCASVPVNTRWPAREPFSTSANGVAG